MWYSTCEGICFVKKLKNHSVHRRLRRRGPSSHSREDGSLTLVHICSLGYFVFVSIILTVPAVLLRRPHPLPY